MQVQVSRRAPSAGGPRSFRRPSVLSLIIPGTLGLSAVRCPVGRELLSPSCCQLRASTVRIGEVWLPFGAGDAQVPSPVSSARVTACWRTRDVLLRSFLSAGFQVNMDSVTRDCEQSQNPGHQMSLLSSFFFSLNSSSVAARHCLLQRAVARRHSCPP